MTDGGWYLCPESMSGTTFGVYSMLTAVNFMEAMAYSQEAIQLSGGASVSFVGIDNVFSGIAYPVSNALQNIVVLLASNTAR